MIFTVMALAASTGLNIAKPHNYPGDWITPEDYPSEQLNKYEIGYVSFSLLVDLSGRVSECIITNPSRSSILNALTCSLLERRAKFFPATGPDGAATYGVFHSSVSWLSADDTYSLKMLQKKYPAPPSYDIEVAVNKLPGADDSPVTIDLGLFVDATGKNIACQSADSKQDQSMVHIACNQAMNLWKPIPMKRAENKPTVQEVKVIIGKSR